MKSRETNIKNGRIECHRHGSLTATDCTLLQDSSCESCFIYSALKDQDYDEAEFVLPEIKSLNEMNKSVN